ncbi:MAG TPA: right-handed parallel beta-helix repeat-containing protein, partial [Thermoanaerobaculia bacterium]|nr:right-handed parallel beta-helix repeat-containing protein [Thermoanaerobaculia bacterium]
NVLVTAQSNVGIAVGPDGRLEGSRLDVSRSGDPQRGGGIVFLSNGSEVHASLINENLGAGIVIGPPDGSRPVSGNVIDGTTISSNLAGVVLSPGSTRNSITRNDIMWNRLGGVTITPYDDKPAPRENRFSANRYDENGLRPIVLNLESEPNSLARAGDCDRDRRTANNAQNNLPNNGIPAPLIASAQISNEDTAPLVTIRGRACPGQVVELYQSFVTSSVREKVGVEMPRIRGVKNEVETITNSEREMTLPSIGEFNYIGSANTASDGTFEATFPFLIVKEGVDKATLDVDRDTDIWARDVLRSAKPEERAFSAVAIDTAGNTSEMSVRRKVERRVATREQR